jgi:hypothetical protein
LFQTFKKLTEEGFKPSSSACAQVSQSHCSIQSYYGSSFGTHQVIYLCCNSLRPYPEEAQNVLDFMRSNSIPLEESVYTHFIKLHLFSGQVTLPMACCIFSSHHILPPMHLPISATDNPTPHNSNPLAFPIYFHRIPVMVVLRLHRVHL